MAGLEDILSGLGGGLQAFGAGVQGKGQEFLLNRGQNLRNLSSERKQALLEDSVDVLGRLERGDTQGAIGVLDSRLQALQGVKGADPSDTQELKALIMSGNTEQAISELKGLEDKAVRFGRLKARAAPAESFSEVLDASGNIVGQKSSATGKVISDPRAVNAKSGLAREKLTLDQKKFAHKQAMDLAKDTEEAVAEVQSSKILDDGTIIYAMKDGSRIVTDSAGNKIEGTDATKAVKEAVKFGIDTQGNRAKSRTSASETIKSSIRKADAAFDRIGPIRSTIQSIDQAVQAIDDGANTGVVQKFLPSVKAASVRLDTLMNQLGLDVVSSTTFGALSEGELRLALETALPTGLEPAELRKWLVDKKAVQEKLVNGLENAVVHLMEGGTISSLVKQKRGATVDEPQQTPAMGQQGGPTATPAQPEVLNFDAEGNLIQ